MTGRSFRNVVDDAVFAVFAADYRDGYGADGDHLKNIPDIDTALDAGMHYRYKANGCAALSLSRDGQSRVIAVDMTNDVAALEGMVCGGTMEVLIQDLPRREE